MIENQSIQPARASRSLPVLLLVCAGALLIIAFTLAGNLHDAQSTQVARATSPVAACNVTGAALQQLPLDLQSAMKSDCAMLSNPTIR